MLNRKVQLPPTLKQGALSQAAAPSLLKADLQQGTSRHSRTCTGLVALSDSNRVGARCTAPPATRCKDSTLLIWRCRVDAKDCACMQQPWVLRHQARVRIYRAVPGDPWPQREGTAPVGMEHSMLREPSKGSKTAT